MPTVTVIQPKAADNEHRLLRIAAYCRVCSRYCNMFQSTPSARRETLETLKEAQAALISIHSLREEGDSKTIQ